MSERQFNQPCSEEDGCAEVAALPAELSSLLAGGISIKTATATSGPFPTFIATLTLGDRAVECPLDVALVAHVYGYGGLPQAIKFILDNMGCCVEGLIQEVQRGKAA